MPTTRPTATVLRVPETLDTLVCAVCGEPLGAYEPLWRFARGRGERTSLLRMAEDATPGEPMWHLDCALDAGVAR